MAFNSGGSGGKTKGLSSSRYHRDDDNSHVPQAIPTDPQYNVPTPAWTPPQNQMNYGQPAHNVPTPIGSHGEQYAYGGGFTPMHTNQFLPQYPPPAQLAQYQFPTTTQTPYQPDPGHHSLLSTPSPAHYPHVAPSFEHADYQNPGWANNSNQNSEELTVGEGQNMATPVSHSDSNNRSQYLHTGYRPPSVSNTATGTSPQISGGWNGNRHQARDNHHVNNNPTARYENGNGNRNQLGFNQTRDHNQQRASLGGQNQFEPQRHTSGRSPRFAVADSGNSSRMGSGQNNHHEQPRAGDSNTQTSFNDNDSHSQLPQPIQGGSIPTGPRNNKIHHRNALGRRSRMTETTHHGSHDRGNNYQHQQFTPPASENSSVPLTPNPPTQGSVSREPHIGMDTAGESMSITSSSEGASKKKLPKPDPEVAFFQKMGAFTLRLAADGNHDCRQCAKNARIAENARANVRNTLLIRSLDLQYMVRCNKVLTKTMSLSDAESETVECEYCVVTEVEKRQCEYITLLTKATYPKNKPAQAPPPDVLDQYDNWQLPQQMALLMSAPKYPEPSLALAGLSATLPSEESKLPDRKDEVSASVVVPEHVVQFSQDGSTELESITPDVVAVAAEPVKVLGTEGDQSQEGVTATAPAPSESGRTNSDQQIDQPVQTSNVEPRYFSEIGKVALAAETDCKNCTKDVRTINTLKAAISNLLTKRSQDLDEYYLSQCEEMLKKNVLDDQCEKCATLDNEKRQVHRIDRFTRAYFPADGTINKCPMPNLDEYPDMEGDMILGPINELVEARQFATRLEDELAAFQSANKSLSDNLLGKDKVIKEAAGQSELSKAATQQAEARLSMVQYANESLSDELLGKDKAIQTAEEQAAIANAATHTVQETLQQTEKLLEQAKSRITEAETAKLTAEARAIQAESELKELRAQLEKREQIQTDIGTINHACTMTEVVTIVNIGAMNDEGTRTEVPPVVDVGTMGEVCTMETVVKGSFSLKKVLIVILALLTIFPTLAIIFGIGFSAQPSELPFDQPDDQASDLIRSRWYEADNQSLHTIETETYWLEGRMHAELAQAAGLPIFYPYGGWDDNDTSGPSDPHDTPNIFIKAADALFGSTLKVTGWSAACLTATMIHYRPSLSARSQ